MDPSKNRCFRCGTPVGAGLDGATCAACLLEEAMSRGDLLNDEACEPASEPRRFGAYELLEEIGRGGNGLIYRARQPGLERTVALKLLLAGEFADEPARKRLLREARAIARLSHPNIVIIHEVGEHDGRPFIAMEYISGGNLADAVQGGPMPIAKVAEYGVQLARAVDYAHRQGVIHRDLKPANVLVDVHGTAKLTDFGLTKLATDLTHTIESAGSPNFMAPEQASRELGATGPHTDVFGLGAILYYLLTGRAPFSGGMLAETLRAVVEHNPPEPRALRKDVPPDLETICLKCLRKRPAERYASGREVAEDLQRFLRWEPIRARRIGVAGRLARWISRNPSLAALLATCFVALLAVSWQWRRSVALELFQRKNAYAASMLLAQQRYEAFNIAAARDLLDELRPAVPAQDLRGFEWYYLNRLCHQEERVLALDQGSVYSLAFSPEGRFLAAAVSNARDGKSELQLIDLARPGTITGIGSGEYHLAMSPDGKLLAGTRADHSINLRAFPSGVVQKTFHGHTADLKSVAFSPDGRILASGGADQTVRLWNVSSGEPLRVLGANTNRGVFSVAWDPSGATLISGGDDNVARVFDVATGAVVRVLRGHSSYVYSVAFSPDGRSIATGSGDYRVLLWDADTGQRRHELRGHNSFVYAVAFSPDGTQLASAGWDNTVRLWDANTGEQKQILRGASSFLFSLAFAPNGKMLAAGGHESAIRLWDPRADLGPVTCESSRGALGRIERSPDANRLLTFEWGHRVCLRDAQNGREIQSWPSATAVFLPDKRRLAVGMTNGTVQLCDAGSGELVRSFAAHSALLDQIAVSPDGQRYATAAGGEAKLWARLGQRPLLTTHTKPYQAWPVVFSPDSRWFVTTDPESKVHIWEAQTGREAQTFSRPAHEGGGLRISPDSKLAATCDYNACSVWELETGKRLFDFETLPSNTSFACFSPDSESILTSAPDPILHLRDSRTGRIRFTLRGHSGSVLASAFTPDGRRIATAGDDHTIKIWDAESGRELLSIQGHDKTVRWLAFFDGQRLASSGQDSTGKIWLAPVDPDRRR